MTIDAVTPLWYSVVDVGSSPATVPNPRMLQIVCPIRTRDAPLPHGARRGRQDNAPQKMGRLFQGRPPLLPRRFDLVEPGKEPLKCSPAPPRTMTRRTVTPCLYRGCNSIPFRSESSNFLCAGRIHILRGRCTRKSDASHSEENQRIGALWWPTLTHRASLP